MKKNAIWLIVGLMSLALLAIILLQAYWIYEAIKLNEEKFNADVQTTLYNVAIALNDYEEEVIATKTQLSNNGLTLSTPSKGLLKTDLSLIHI